MERILEDLELPLGYGTDQILLTPVPERVQAFVGEVAVVDTVGAQLMREPGRLPVYYFPASDVRSDLLVPSATVSTSPRKGAASYWSVQVEGRLVPDALWSYPAGPAGGPDLTGLMAAYWKKMDAWYVGEQPALAHARDPDHTVETQQGACHVRVSAGGQVLAETDRPVLLAETHLPVRYYIPKADVRLDLLVPTDTVTACAYKGRADQWWAAGGRDVAWCYAVPAREHQLIADYVCFFQERVDVEVDGHLLDRPRTPWSE